MKNPFLRQAKTIQHNRRSCEFKETDCGRFFVWIPKYSLDDEEVNRYGFKKEEHHNTETYIAARDKHIKDVVEVNAAKGKCVELGKQNYASILESHRDSEKTLAGNKRNLEPDGSNPRGLQIYTGAPEDNARKRYESKENKYPYNWERLMGKWGSHRTVVDVLANSDRFHDGNKEIEYDREFFDSIDFNQRKAKRALGVLKKFVEEKFKTMETYEKYANQKDSIAIKKFTNRLKLQIYFSEKAIEMDAEIKKMLPKDRQLIEQELNYDIKFNSSSRGLYTSVYR
jgi:hypothetical protein